ncbi:MAG: DUF374 domain-containing protein [Pseudomonadota bacterium]
MNGLQRRWRNFEIRLQKSDRIQNALKALYTRYVSFCYRTIRWERLGLEIYEADVARGVPRLLCFWHEQLVMMPYMRDWSDHGAGAIVSRHADAQIMAAHMRGMGIEIIEVGTSDVNIGPVRDSVRHLRAGKTLAITVDGPMGPAREPKPGALVIASLARLPVSPCACTVTRFIRLRTWDRLIVPLPWGRGVISVGEGFTPKPKMTEAEMTEAQARLTDLIEAQEDICAQHLKQA